MLVQIAEAHDAKCVQTLTGFKWMLNAALQLERERGLRFVFGYEEALGYCVAGPVLDKDGISAGLLFADMAAEARGLGRTILDELADLYARHGVWVSHLTNLAFEATPDALARAGASVRRLAAEPPQELSGLLVKRVRDYTCGESERPWYLGWADLVELELEGEARVLVRPSGTEPKLKIYADLKRAFQPRVAVAEQEHAAESRVEQLAEAMADFLRTL
jgi:phosphomannomutase